MNKKIMISAIVVILASVLFTSVAAAQSTTSCEGWMQKGGFANGTDGSCLLHDEMLAAYAEELGISVTDLEARLEAGETMRDVALSTGLTWEEFRTVRVAVREAVVAQALEDGTITQEQADLMLRVRGGGAGHGGGGMMGGGKGGRGGMGGNNGTCPNGTTTTP